MSSAKEEILSTIRRSISDSRESVPREYSGIDRLYCRSGHLDGEARLALFAKMLLDYDATVHLSSESNLCEAIAEALEKHHKTNMLAANDVPEEWLPLRFKFHRDSGLSYDEIGRFEGVLTRCAVAIASTGTIVLTHSTEGGRRALTLLPDFHLCVVYANQIVETVPEGIGLIARHSSVPLTTISGPSATSDIEMTRIKGVHGPRTLAVVIVT